MAYLSTICSKSNGDVRVDVGVSVLFFVSSNFPKKRALRKASQDVFTLGFLFKG